jgi:hypothetical protein
MFQFLVSNYIVACWLVFEQDKYKLCVSAIGHHSGQWRQLCQSGENYSILIAILEIERFTVVKLNQ